MSELVRNFIAKVCSGSVKQMDLLTLPTLPGTEDKVE